MQSIIKTRKPATWYLKAICIEREPLAITVEKYTDVLVAELSGILKYYILRMEWHSSMMLLGAKIVFSYTTNHKATYIYIDVIPNFGMVFAVLSSIS